MEARGARPDPPLSHRLVARTLRAAGGPRSTDIVCAIDDRRGAGAFSVIEVER